MQKGVVYQTTYLWLERAFLLLLGCYLFLRIQLMTTFYTVYFYSPFPPKTESVLLGCLIAVTSLKTIFRIFVDPEQRKGWIRLVLLSLPVAAAWLLAYQEDPSPYVLILVYYAVIIIGCVGTDYRTLLKVQVCVVGAVVVSAAFCCFIGAIDNLVYWNTAHHGTIRSSWGIDYVTDMAAYWFYLCLAAWIAWDRTPGWIFLIPGAICLWISYEIAQSSTGVLCSILLLLAVLWVCLAERKGEGKILRGIQKIVNVCSCAAFPVCALLMVSFTWAYHEGYPFAQRLDEWNHARLSLASAAFDNYGIHLFGFNFPMVGAGGSTFNTPGYNYVDCGYLQLLLRYGLILFVIYMLLWPLMTRTAAKNQRQRLVLGLALIAVHTVSEQRFLGIDYNFLLAAPFSVFSIKLLPDRQPIAFPVGTAGNRRRPAAIATAGLFLLVTVLFWKPVLSWVRTIWSVIEITDPKYQNLQRMLLLFACLLGCAVLVWVIRLVYRVLVFVFQRQRPSARDAVPLLLILILGSAVLIRGNRRIDRAAEENADMIVTDAPVIQAAYEIDGLKLYVTDLPTLYDRQYNKPAVSLYSGDDLARLKNIAIIADSSWNSPILFHSGFFYTEISEAHAVYTDSDAFMDRLTELGYPAPTPYFSKRVVIPLADLAEWNNLSFTDGGGLLISKDHPLVNVWNIDLQGSTYLICLDLNFMEPRTVSGESPEEPVFLFRLTDYSGMRVLLEQNIPYSRFDETGHLSFEISYIFSAPGIEFHIIPQNGAELELLSASYQGVA